MKLALLLLFPTLSFAQFYHFEKGEKFTVKESRWTRRSNDQGQPLKPWCQLLGISEIEVVEQFKEDILFKVLKNRGSGNLLCAPGDLVHTNDVLAHTLKNDSQRYWVRKNKILSALRGEHPRRSLNGVHIGDRYSLSEGWDWAVVEESVTVDGELYWETRVCRIYARGSMKVIGLFAEEEEVLLEYDMPHPRTYKECPNKIVFAKPLKRF